MCYRGDKGISQQVGVDDVAYIASYLRSYSAKNPKKNVWTMTEDKAADCGEWSVYKYRSALVVAKLIDMSKDASVIYGDIATTIDGGVNATIGQRNKALISSLKDGGSMGVVANVSNPVYESESYTSNGSSPTGILVKVVHNG